MKIKTFFALASMIAMPTLFSSCGMSSSDIKALVKASKGEFRDSKEWGKVIDKSIDINSDISALEMNGAIDCVLTQSDSLSIIVKGNEKAIEKYEITTDNDRFTVNKKEKFKSVNNIPSISIIISAPNINDIVVNGAGDIEVKNDYSIDGPLNVVINGAGDLDIKKMKCENLSIVINGAGDVKAKQITCNNKAEFAINGAGDIEASIKSNSISTNIAGAGDADLDVNCNNLNVSVSGTGDIKLKGKCINFRKSESNLGSINSKDLQYQKKQ